MAKFCCCDARSTIRTTALLTPNFAHIGSFKTRSNTGPIKKKYNFTLSFDFQSRFIKFASFFYLNQSFLLMNCLLEGDLVSFIIIELSALPIV